MLPFHHRQHKKLWHRYNDRADTFRAEFLRRQPCGPFILHLDSGQEFRLGFIRSNQEKTRINFLRQFRRRSRIQNHGDTSGGSPFRRAENRLQRSLKLHEQNIRRFDCTAGGVQILRIQGSIGSRSDGNTVFPLGVDHDQCHAGRIFRINQHMIGMNLLLLPERFGFFAEQIISDLGNKCDISSHAGGGDSLVGSEPTSPPYPYWNCR